MEHNEYLVGEKDENGQFWCWKEYKDSKAAHEHWKSGCEKYPNLDIQLIKRTTNHSVVLTSKNQKYANC